MHSLPNIRNLKELQMINLWTKYALTFDDSIPFKLVRRKYCEFLLVSNVLVKYKSDINKLKYQYN